MQRKIAASDNTAMLQKVGRDPNMIFSTRIDVIYGLVGLMEKASESSSRLRVPTACLYGAKDQIIPRPSAEKAARALPEGARTAVYPNGYHMLLRDPQAQVVWDDVLSFLKDPAAPFPSGAAPLLAGKRDR